MKLSTWKKRNNYTYIDIANMLTISKTSVYNILSDSYLPSDDIIKRIETVTNGAVKKRDFPKIHPKTCPECGKIISKRYKRKERET